MQFHEAHNTILYNYFDLIMRGVREDTVRGLQYRHSRLPPPTSPHPTPPSARPTRPAVTDHPGPAEPPTAETILRPLSMSDDIQQLRAH